MTFFQHALENELETNRSKNTYFMDGGNRFISVPNLGYHSRPCASIARLFEDWLAEKLYCQPTAIIAEQRLPILQDSVELVAEDILNKIKSNLVWRKSIDKVLIKVRAGHVYTYHSLEDGQPLITQEMEELFQQFPLFVEMQVYATLKAGCSSTQCMLVVENVTVNPQQPYKIMEEF
ncbi:hypothetical protein DM01DRAFT_267006 [Hesseltinella vesiculosa]|uniref:Uncharacterized protein n=1 Tax=Hesseltinella vesiculosa TaxID=101127 RepID=A0A1X2G6Z3_9FUNG|nr:hypothetical protein DM01DRAFT_267006 [Hesseltinella vesiculosa]